MCSRAKCRASRSWNGCDGCCGHWPPAVNGVFEGTFAVQRLRRRAHVVAMLKSAYFLIVTRSERHFQISLLGFFANQDDIL